MNQIPSFKPLELTDCPLLHRWLQLPHVRAFWDDGLRTQEAVREYYFEDNGVLRFLFFIDQKPAGYIQAYPIRPQDPYGAYALPAKETQGIDLFIGDETFLNQGLARPILAAFIAAHCQGAARILVDPEIRNIKAIHVYEAFGFRKVGVFSRSNKDHALMVIDL